MQNGTMAHLKTACGPPVAHGPPVGNHCHKANIVASHSLLSRGST